MGKGTRNRQFTKLQGLKTFKHPALDVWGFSLSRKETQREGRQPQRNKEYHVASIPVWLPPQGRRPYFSELRSEAPGMKTTKRCLLYTGPGKPPTPCLHPVRPAHKQNTHNPPGLHPWGFLPAPSSGPSPPSSSLQAFLPGLWICFLTASASPLEPTALDRWCRPSHLPSSFAVKAERLAHSAESRPGTERSAA